MLQVERMGYYLSYYDQAQEIHSVLLFLFKSGSCYMLIVWRKKRKLNFLFRSQENCLSTFLTYCYILVLSPIYAHLLAR